MAETFFPAGAGGGGGGDVILRANGAANTTVTATLAGDGTKTRTGVIDDKGFLQLKLPSLGLWKVESHNGEDSFTQDVRVFRYGITETWTPVNKPIAQCSFEEIDTVIKAGLYNKFWSIGDTMAPITEVDDLDIVFQIVGFDCDHDADGNTIPITLISVDCLRSLQKNNEQWNTNHLRTETIPSIKERLPEGFVSMIKTTPKTYQYWFEAVGYGNNYKAIVNDDLWVPGQDEIVSIYPYFTMNERRIKKLDNNPIIWATRDISRNDGHDNKYVHVSVNNTGAVGYSVGSSLLYCPLGCCLGTTL